MPPETSGVLVTLYGHKIFMQSVIWNINANDQMGVELGKQLAQAILPEFMGERDTLYHASSTNGLNNDYN